MYLWITMTLGRGSLPWVEDPNNNKFFSIDFSSTEKYEEAVQQQQQKERKEEQEENVSAQLMRLTQISSKSCC